MQPDSHDFTAYLHELLLAKAQQQLEPVRILLAQYQGVLASFSHLQPEIDALLTPQTGRDYALLETALRTGLQNLEKLLATLVKAHDEHLISVVEADDITALAELYSCRMANQVLQKITAAKRKEPEQAKKVSEKAQAKSRQVDKARVKTEQDNAAASQKRLKLENRFVGWQKIGKKGEPLPATAERWAAVIDASTELMWAVNWQIDDRFPNRGDLTWFNPDMSANGGHEGYASQGQNTSDWLRHVNLIGWCGFTDWRLPTLREIETLLTKEVSNYFHIREDVFTDMAGLGSRFWTASVDDKKKEYAWAMYFGYGHDGLAYKSYTLNVRLVRGGGELRHVLAVDGTNADVEIETADFDAAQTAP